jgi:hypothetical protein
MPCCATTSNENPRNLRSIRVISVTIFRTVHQRLSALAFDECTPRPIFRRIIVSKIELLRQD